MRRRRKFHASRLRRMVFACALVSCVSLTTWPSRADTSATNARLDYVRGRGAGACPDEAAIRAAVGARLGRDPFAEEAGQTIAVRLAAASGELTASVELVRSDRSSAGQRKIVTRGSDCTELATAVVLAICIAIDPIQIPPRQSSETTDGRPAPPSTAPPAEPSPLPGPSNAPPPGPAPPAASPSAPAFRAGAGVAGALGAAPAIAASAMIHASAKWRVFSLGVEGRADLPSGRDAAPGYVSASLLLVEILPCLHRGILAACLNGAIGALSGTGDGVDIPLRDTTLYVALGARLAAELPITDAFLVRPWIDVLGTVTRTSLYLDGRPVWTTPPLSGALGIGLIGVFW